MTTLFDFSLKGEHGKAVAHELLEIHRGDVIREARRVMLRKLLADGEATADDVRDAVEIPHGIDPVCLGAVPGPLAKAGIIKADGFVKTKRAKAHVRPVTRWVLADAAKAAELLAALGTAEGGVA